MHQGMDNLISARVSAEGALLMMLTRLLFLQKFSLLHLVFDNYAHAPKAVKQVYFLLCSSFIILVADLIAVCLR